MAAAYDGDTPAEERERVRASVSIIVTNPDTLHRALLPNHDAWSQWLSHLRVVALDEAHVLTGLLGAHGAMVVRRLRRLAEQRYGARPVFVVTSATMGGDPGQHAAALVGCDPSRVGVIDVDGAPRGRHTTVLWNPPLRNEEREGGAGEKGGATRWRGKRRAPPVADGGAVGGMAPAEGPRPAPGVRRTLVGRNRAAAAAGPTGEPEDRHQPLRSRPETAPAAVAALPPPPPPAPGPVFPSLAAVGALMRAAVREDEAADLTSTGDAPRRSPRRLPMALASLPPPPPPTALIATDAADPADVDSRSGPSRLSPVVETARLLAEATQHGLRCLAFCWSRRVAETVCAHARDLLKQTAPSLVSRVATYRGGYTPADRRDLEQAVADGRLLAVATTNALELGVDLGALDVVLHVGFPGSLASLRQQAGRAGRRGQPSASVLVAFDTPLDQYLLRRPVWLDPGRRPAEAVTTGAGYLGVVDLHLACAAAEHPLLPGAAAGQSRNDNERESTDDSLFGSASLAGAVARLVVAGALGRGPTSQRHAWVYIGREECPAASFGLRAGGEDRLRVVDGRTGNVVEELELSTAFRDVYEGAVYFHQGRTWLCTRLDVDGRVATIRPAACRHRTKALISSSVQPAGGRETFASAVDAACVGDARVETRWLGYQKIWASGRVFETVQHHLPPARFLTRACWVRAPLGLRAHMTASRLPFADGLHAAAHAVLAVLPLAVPSAPGDVLAECGKVSGERYCPERLLLFDAVPGGCGAADAARERLPELLGRAVDLLDGCPCSTEVEGEEAEADDRGCPRCTLSSRCLAGNTRLHRGAGIAVLRALLAQVGGNGEQQIDR